MTNPIPDAELSLLAGGLTGRFTPEQKEPFGVIGLAIDGKFDDLFKNPLVLDFLRIPSEPAIDSVFNIVPLVAPGGLGSDKSELFSLAIGVACLHSFFQENWTGPSLEAEPITLLGLAESRAIDSKSLNAISIAGLALGGEPAYHLAKKAAFLRLAQLIFDLPYQYIRTASWWKMRTMRVQQQLLDEPVGVPSATFVPKPLARILFQARSFPSTRILRLRLRLTRARAHQTRRRAIAR